MTERTDRTKRMPTGIRVGVAGWSYPDWAGYVYPTRRPKGFHEATYLAQFFDTIEINTSFYAPIRSEHAAQWIDRVSANPRFLFTAKLWQRFTHDVVPSAPPSLDDEKLVRVGFDVLRAARKLGAVLLQFPFAFHYTPESLTYLLALLQRFGDYPLVVELRHASWKTDAFFALLSERGVGFCNLDQPVIGRSLEPTATATSAIGYVRLHGRRYDTWFSDDPETPSHERYNYLYSRQELLPWAERAREVAAAAAKFGSPSTTRSAARQNAAADSHADAKTDSRDDAASPHSTYVVTNNHYLGKAAVNALELISILKGGKVEVPEPLRKHYPELEAIAARPAESPTLF
jgi:uncharacterized protein YecE (DUF72 family)